MGKDDDEKTDEEIRLLQLFEDRRRRRNEKWKEKRIETKQEIERILAIPESERTKKDLLTLEAVTKEKQKKSESNRIYRCKRNGKWREKRIEKKQEVERILAIPESERTKQDLLALEAFTKEKQKRSERDKAYIRAKNAKYRDKIAEAKGKDDDEKTDEEIRLLQLFEDRRRRRNEKWKEKRIE